MGWCALTTDDTAGDGENVLTLAELIAARTDERRWSRRTLAARGDDATTFQNWSKLARGDRLKRFPEPATLEALAKGLGVSITTVVLGAARQVGHDVQQRGSDFAALLPAGIDEIPREMRDALLGLMHAAVTTYRAHRQDDEGGVPRTAASVPRGVFEWDEVSDTGRNAARRTGDPRG